MPLLSGPARLPVDLPYLDRYCYEQGDEDGGVDLLCRTCSGGAYPVAYLGQATATPAGAVTAQDITSLIDAGMRHVAEYHPEP